MTMKDLIDRLQELYEESEGKPEVWVQIGRNCHLISGARLDGEGDLIITAERTPY